MLARIETTFASVAKRSGAVVDLPQQGHPLTRGGRPPQRPGTRDIRSRSWSSLSALPQRIRRRDRRPRRTIRVGSPERRTSAEADGTAGRHLRVRGVLKPSLYFMPSIASKAESFWRRSDRNYVPGGENRSITRTAVASGRNKPRFPICGPRVIAGRSRAIDSAAIRACCPVVFTIGGFDATLCWAGRVSEGQRYT